MRSSVVPGWRGQGDGRDYCVESMVWLRQDAKPRLMVDGQLKLVWYNDAGAELLSQRHEIESVKGILTTTNRAMQAELLLFVKSAALCISTWQLARKHGDGFMLFRAMRLDGETVGLTAIRTGAEYEQRFADLDVAFKLTASEHRVLVGLLGGDEAEKLARFHGVSLETIRTHIRNIYAKMAVNSRESLFARALPFRI